MNRATSLASVIQQLAARTGVRVGALALQASGWLQGQARLASADFPPAFPCVARVSVSSLLWLSRLGQPAGAAISGLRPTG